MIGLLLAAGRGARFDPSGASSKLLSTLSITGTQDGAAGQTCFAHSLRHLSASVSRCYCVLAPLGSLAAGHASPGHVAQLNQLALSQNAIVIHAPHAARGMGESLSFAAARILQDMRAQGISTLPPLLVHLADMPWVSGAMMGRLAAALSGPDSIVAPRAQGQRGNPVLFGADHWRRFPALRADQGARQMINAAERAGKLTLLDIGSDAVLRDIDTPADLTLSDSDTYGKK